MRQLCFIAVCFLAVPALIGQDARVLDETLKEARSLLYDQKLEPALAKFEEVLKKDPNNLEAYLGKMNALGSLRKNQDVQKMAAAKSKTTTIDGSVINANGLIWKRDFAGAMEQLTRVHAKKGNGDYMAQYLAGYIQYRSRKPDAAIPFLQKAIELNKEYPESYYLLGDIYMKKSDANNTVKYWNEYLKRVPKSGKRYQYVNSTLQKMGGN